MSSKVVSIVVVGVVAVAACSTNSVDTTTTRHTSATTTTVPIPSETCSDRPHIPLDPDARATASIVADVDGDGFDDTVTGYLLGSTDATVATGAVIHLELGSGWGTALRVDELALTGAPVLAEPEAVVVLGGDTLIVAGVGGIAAGKLFAFVAFEDCDLGIVSLSNGEMPEIWMGGGRTHDDWFVCESDRVSVVQFGTSNPDAEPRMYGAGAALTFDYVDGEFTRARPSDIDAALPATRQEVERVYPPCVG